MPCARAKVRWANVQWASLTPSAISGGLIMDVSASTISLFSRFRFRLMLGVIADVPPLTGVDILEVFISERSVGEPVKTYYF